ncbi:MAG: glutamate 5-kinase [Brevinematales bacterium]|jgi:glutamate 5-kinase
MLITLPDKRELSVKRVVVKLGTKQLTDLTSINTENISGLVREIAQLRKKGVEFVITSSGAIGLGIFELYKDKDVSDKLTLSQKQAIAGLGQVRLMQIFKEEFNRHGLRVGQVLLTHYIFDNRTSYLNARNTLNSMLELGITPIINENDSVAVEEIKVGENDRLGAYVSLLSDSNLYIMLSDVDGFYQDYGTSSAKFIRVVDNIGAVMKYACKQEENYTKGGMISKLQAARIAARSGVPCVIANGFKKSILTRIFEDLSEGTIFLPSPSSLNYKKRWISVKKPRGTIIVDDGAKNAVLLHKSLLASGISSASGNFQYGDTVIISDSLGNEIGVGLSNYSQKDILLIAGRKNSEIETILGKESKYSSVVHIDNMVLSDDR